MLQLLIIVIIIAMLFEERILSIFHLHLGQGLGRKTALSKMFTDPYLQFCLRKQPVRCILGQKCTLFFVAVVVVFLLVISRALFESREINKKN